MQETLDWRRIFAALRISWRDTGKNTSSGNVNICCPFCGDDYGYHLSVAEDKPAYYCFRQPLQHSGTNLIRLLTTLGASRAEAVELLATHASRITTATVRGVPAELPDMTKAWGFFDPIGISGMRYMRERGFSDIEFIAAKFDIRQAASGQWAQRVLLPIKSYAGTVHSWTGRAIRDDLDPRYKNLPVTSLVYNPRPERLPERLVIVEGPIDALKITAAVNSVDAIALMGLNINAEKLMFMRQWVKNPRQISVTLDSNTRVTDAYALIAQITMLTDTSIKRLALPFGKKDAGEMSYNEIRNWL